MKLKTKRVTSTKTEAVALPVAVLFDRFNDRLREMGNRFACRTKNRMRATDFVQQAFLRMKATKLTPEHFLRRAYVVIQSVFIDYIRSREFNAPIEYTWVDRATCDKRWNQSQCPSAEVVAEYFEEYCSTHPKQEDALRKIFFEGMTVRSAAARNRVSTQTVHRWKRQALEELRRKCNRLDQPSVPIGRKSKKGRESA